MFPTVQLGPLALPVATLVLMLSYMVALEASHRAADRLQMNGDDVYNLGYLAAIGGLLGARLGYVLDYWPVFRSDPAAMFALTADGLSPSAGLAAALIAGFAYARHRGLAARRLLDALAPGLLVLAGGLALADLASGDGYGSPSTLPWAITLWGVQRHPVQVYHLLATIAIAVVLLRASRPFDGAHFGLFVALYAASFLFLDAFHAEGSTIAGLRTVQVASLLVLMAMLYLLRRWAVESAAQGEKRADSDGVGLGSG